MTLPTSLMTRLVSSQRLLARLASRSSSKILSESSCFELALVRPAADLLVWSMPVLLVALAAGVACILLTYTAYVYHYNTQRFGHFFRGCTISWLLILLVWGLGTMLVLP